MIKNLLKLAFGSRNARLLKQYHKILQSINGLEATLSSLSDQDLKSKTTEFKTRVQKGCRLEDLLPEAFAVVREAAKRTLKMRHFDVQMIGGMALFYGKIAEMHTGEGKTLVATLPAYLGALAEKGVHIITVNDYLAERDAKWMQPIYEFLGLSVGVIVSDMKKAPRKAAYAADITYGTNNEFGFDYLRDNMAFSLDERVQRPLHYAIIDEVDSILIDEARTPLIISGPVQDDSDLYEKINQLVPKLSKAIQNNKEKDAPEDNSVDYLVEEKGRNVYLTEKGQENVEQLLKTAGLLGADDALYQTKNINILHHLHAALKAHALFHRDVDYIVKNNEIVIVDEHTGRTMVGRRWSEGIHQAVEAKEGVKIQHENQTLASITFQNFFRIYDHLAGMTGTADTEAYEFQHIYSLEVVVIPTNQPNQREDHPDLIFLTEQEKFKAVINDIKSSVEKKQPVLVGTASIEASEVLSQLLKQEKINHQVLNAKFHEKEAHIIAEAGRPGRVTIATNMAGRGTDIVLGGNLNAQIEALNNPSADKVAELQATWQEQHDEVLKAGGLKVIGSERHESRRIDNQLRGRCARQGDPGASVFYLSLEDTLMRIFAPPSLKAIMQKLGMREGEAIRSHLVTRAIENAQRKVESHNFDIRKQLLEYDDVANQQRSFIYTWRDELMHSQGVSETIDEMIVEATTMLAQPFIPENSLEEQWDIPGLTQALYNHFQLKCPIQQWLDEDEDLHADPLREKILANVQENYQRRKATVGEALFHSFEQAILLQCLDQHWKEHLASMDQLREGIHLRGYAQKDPKQEYKREAFDLFSDLLDAIKLETVSILLSVDIASENDVATIEAQRRDSQSIPLNYQHDAITALATPEAHPPTDNPSHLLEDAILATPYTREAPKIGRNQPCQCGSGKKFKHCCGQMA